MSQELECVHCGDKFDKKAGFSGSETAPYCFKPECFKAYMQPAADVVAKFRGLSR